MSVDIDDIRKSGKQAHKTRDEQDGEKKRKRKAIEAVDAGSPTKKKRTISKDAVSLDSAASKNYQVSQTSLSLSTCPLHEQTSSLYLPIAPICQTQPVEALCAEHLSPLILSYYPPFHGVIMSYGNPRCGANPCEATATDRKEAAYAKAIDEYAASFIWLTADFLVFRPCKGDMLGGYVTLQNESSLGLVCWNFFNASIESGQLPQDWKWVGGGTKLKRSIKKLKRAAENMESEDSHVQDSDGHVVQTSGNHALNTETEAPQGYFQDGSGAKVEGIVQFYVRHVETSRSADRESGFLSIEGTMINPE